METIVLEKKRKNIDLPVDTLRKLSIMAASQGQSLKAYIENLLVSKAQMFEMNVRENPSPSGDPWFNNPANVAEIEARLKERKEGKTKVAVTLNTPEEIRNYINNL